MRERDLIARLRRQFPRIGDDGAVVGSQVITIDILVEDVDFTRDIPLRFIARKSIAINLSDLAAMGATPQYLVIGIATPSWTHAEMLMNHIADAARSYKVEVIGGDLSRGEKLMISVTAIGLADRALLRSGAHPGDRIYVSRPIGGAAAGLQLLQSGWRIRDDGTVVFPSQVAYALREFGASAIRRQVDPEPEVALGSQLAQIAEVTACIDISDGLSTDLHNLCDASQCGAEIDRERLPIFPDLPGTGAALGIRAADVVLHGGEEYALLFTSSLRESELSARLGRPVYAIGRITAGGDMILKQDGLPSPLQPHGWDHFA